MQVRLFTCFCHSLCVTRCFDPKLAALILCVLVLPAGAAWAADCNGNGVDDLEEIASGASRDCNANGVLDECELVEGEITFELPRLIPDDGYPYGFVVADFDGDTDLDIATSGQDIRVLRNRGDGVFGEPDMYPLGDRQRWEMLADDLDGNGFADLIAICTDTPEVPVLLNRGDGTFSMSIEELFPYGARRPVLADFDGDGYLDLGASGTRGYDWGYAIFGDVYWNRNRGDGTFEEARILSPVEAAGGMLAADFNGDGAIDIAVLDHSGQDERNGDMAVLLNRGDGAFREPSIYPVGLSPAPRLAADLDGNGSLDLVVLNRASNDLSILRNRGDGTFAETETLPTAVSTGPDQRLHSADLDGDGDTDLIVAANTERPFWTAPIEIAVFLNEGDGTFRVTVITDFTGYVLSLKTADLNGDGRPEIITSQKSYSHGTVSVLENLGEGRFEAAGTFYAGGSHTEVGDIDGDLDLDLVLKMDNGVTLLENVTGGQNFHQGCDPFLRGDVNVDGVVSISDMIMLRRYLFAMGMLVCKDAADVTDDESLNLLDVVVILEALFGHEDWTLTLPEPSSAPGLDLTPIPVLNPFNEGQDLNMDARLGCSRYQIQPAEKTDDAIRIGDVYASPGAEVLVPVFISSSVPVEAVQLVLDYDPEVLEIAPDALSHQGTFFERFSDDGPPRPEISVLTIHSEARVLTVAIAGSLAYDGFEVTPGEDTLIAWIHARVSEDAVPGMLLTLTPTNGDEDQGVGPYRMRNELTFQGEARLVSTFPRLFGGKVIVDVETSIFLFIRGDANSDDSVNVADAVFTLAYLFNNGPPPACPDAADTNDDGNLDLADPIALLQTLFSPVSSIAPPYPVAGSDATPDKLASCKR